MGKLPPFYVRQIRTRTIWELVDARTNVVRQAGDVHDRNMLAERDRLNAAWAKEREQHGKT